jgi:hypothetical protein
MPYSQSELNKCRKIGLYSSEMSPEIYHWDIPKSLSYDNEISDWNMCLCSVMISQYDIVTISFVSNFR